MHNTTIRDILDYAYDNRGSQPFVWYKYKYDFIIKDYKSVIDDVRALAAALLKYGLKAKKILIISENSYEWVVTDFAVTAYTGILVPVDKEWMELDLCAVLDQADVSAVFYSKSKNFLIKSVMGKYSHIKYFSIEEDFQKLLTEGFDVLRKNPDFLRTSAQYKNADAVCKIFYSSGSTGVPKGVPLTANNMLANYESVKKRVRIGPKDVCYLILPLYHVYAGVCVMLYAMCSGVQICLCADITEMRHDLLIVRPTIFCGVPSVLTKFVKRFPTEKMGRYRRKIRTLKTLRTLNIDLRPLCFLSFKGIFGGRLKYLFCGAAAISEDMKELYRSMGIMLLEGYGLTETSGLVSMDYPFDRYYGSAGVVLESLEVMILDPDAEGAGEILVRGRCLSRGYYSNVDIERNVFDAQGYFHTGDIGRLDNNKRLTILGRKKRVLVLANGKAVYPERIERLLTDSGVIARAFVFEKNGMIFATLHTQKRGSQILEIVEKVNLKLPKYSRIKHYELRKPEANASPLKQ